MMHSRLTESPTAERQPIWPASPYPGKLRAASLEPKMIEGGVISARQALSN